MTCRSCNTDLQDIVDTQQLIMAPKSKMMDKTNRAKRQRKVMTLCESIPLLDTLTRSESAASVGRHYGIKESTVCKRESNIRVRVPASKAQKAHSSPVILILKGWKKRLMFGSRTKQKKMPLSGTGDMARNHCRFTNNSTRHLGAEGSSSTMADHDTAKNYAP